MNTHAAALQSGALAAFFPAYRRDMVQGWEHHHITHNNGENYLHQQQAIAQRAPATDDDSDTLYFKTNDQVALGWHEGWEVVLPHET